MEITRKELAYRRDFTLSTAFSCFSKSLQYRVSTDEFLFGLERMDINLLKTDVAAFFRRYDADQDGKLGFWEVSNALLPLEIRTRDEVEQR